MAIQAYNLRLQAPMPYDESRVFAPPSDPRLLRFTEVVWYGWDDEGWCVYRRDPTTGEIARIDFYPPAF